MLIFSSNSLPKREQGHFPKCRTLPLRLKRLSRVIALVAHDGPAVAGMLGALTGAAEVTFEVSSDRRSAAGQAVSVVHWVPSGWIGVEGGAHPPPHLLHWMFF